MNVIKKYWESVYVYILLLIPCLCACAGIFWTVCKMLGFYAHLSWNIVFVFDFSQMIYVCVSFYFIYRNMKDRTYIIEHIFLVKCFICIELFIQYNFIMFAFSSEYVWGCTFLFWIVIIFFL